MQEHVNGTVQKVCVPSNLCGMLNVAEFVAYESDCPATHRRRAELIDKEIKGTITISEAGELAGLQAYADYYSKKRRRYPHNCWRILKSAYSVIRSSICNSLKAFAVQSDLHNHA